MQQVFRSAVSWWLFGPVLGLVLVLPLLPGQSGAGRLFTVGGCLLAAAFLLHMLLTTTYTLTATELLIRCGVLRYRVPVGSITGVVPTRNPLSAPALSLNRLEIRYGRYDFVLISPADQAGFLAALSHLNPAIPHV